jgi:hypothetical protein
VGVLVVILVVTNLVTLGVVGWLLLRRPAAEPDAVVTSALDGSPRPSGALGVRRVITIEILNPIELAGSRGRVAGIAGSLVPNITKRVVYDQALRQIRRDLRSQNVIADVRLHTIRPVTRERQPTLLDARPEQAAPAPQGGVPVYFDEIRRLDLDGDVEERGA